MYYAISLDPTQEEGLGNKGRVIPIARLYEETRDDKGSIRLVPTSSKVYLIERERPVNTRELDLSGLPRSIKPLWIPRGERDGNSVVIYGATGAGKSTFAGNLIREYHKRFPKNRIIIISPHQESDPALQTISSDQIDYLEVDDRIVKEMPLKVDEFQDSLVIMDDYLNFPDKSINKALQEFASKLMVTGRRLKASVILIQHNAFGGHTTVTYNLNAGFLVFFPSILSQRRHIINYLKQIGCDSKLINKVVNLPTRTICISTSAPNFIIHDKGILLI